MPFASRFWPSWRRQGATDEMWRLRTINPTNEAQNPNHLRWLHDGAFGNRARAFVLACTGTGHEDWCSCPPGYVFRARGHPGMGAAFDKVCRSLHNSGQPSIVKEVIAKRIIDLAREGESDSEQLCDMTLKSLDFGAGCNFTK